MKILYVADNRNRGNYGCRATSTALSQLVEKNNVITGTITGRYTHTHNDKLFFIKGLPRICYKYLGRIRHWDDIRIGLFLFFNLLKPHGKVYFSQFDFLSLDLDRAIENLLKCIPANPELEEFDLRKYDFDAMVVNGEGSFIFSTPPWRESITITMLMHWAQKMGKKVFFMNAMFSDSPNSLRNEKTINIVNNVLKKCDIVSVRENKSREYVEQHMKEIKPIVIPDALFSWYSVVNDTHKILDGKYYLDYRVASNLAYKNMDFTKPYICITGSSVSGEKGNKQENINRMIHLVQETKRKFKDYVVYIVEACEGDQYMLEVAQKTKTLVVGLATPSLAAAKILADASVYITGRYHPAIMASLGGTPCVFMGSNSHKTYSLQELLEYETIQEYPFEFTDEICEQILEHAQCFLSQGDDLRLKIKKRAKELSELSERIAEIIQ